MTTSNKNDIISRVQWIFQNRESVIQLESEIESIAKNMSVIIEETNEQLDKLKSDMRAYTSLNIKIGESYYTLTKNSSGVNIESFIIDIVETT